MRTELLVQAGVAVVAAVLYASVARIVQRRELEGPARRANGLFAVWWGTFAVVYGGSAVFHAASAFGWQDLPLALTYITVLLLAVCFGVWGLISYLVYLYTGSVRGQVWLGVAYGVFGLALVYLIAWLEPVGFKEGGIGVQFEYANELPRAVGVAVGLAFAAPVLAAALAYGSLWFRVKAAEPRYRIAVISGSFIVWFGWSVVSTLLGLAQKFPDSWWLYTVNQTIALVVPVAVVLAFHPPKRFRIGPDVAIALAP